MTRYQTAIFFAMLAAAAVNVRAVGAQAVAQTAPQRLGLCATCHGESGIAREHATPNLAGQNLDYLRNAIAQYQHGQRDFAAMRAALGMLSASEIDAILRWYAAQPSRPAQQ